MPPTPRTISRPPRRARTVALAAPLALAATLALLAAAPPATSHAGATTRPSPLARPTPTRVPGSCDAFATRTISPDTGIVGEPATVTLSLRLDCAPMPLLLHVVLAVDDTAAMASPAGRDVLRALRGWVAGLPTRPNEWTLRVGIVGFRASRSSVRCALSTRLHMARRCIDRLSPGGEGDVGDGIDAALDVLKAGRASEVDRDVIREVIVVIGNGQGDASACRRGQAAAGAARGQGVLLIVLAVGDTRDPACLAAFATSPRYAFDFPGRPPALDRIRGVIDSIYRGSHDGAGVFRARMVDEMLPVGMTFVTGGFDPLPNEIDDRQALWRMSFFPREGMTFTYQVRPSSSGVLDVPEQGLFSWWDRRNQMSFIALPPARLRVLSGFIDPWP